ncbi:MAG: amidohydrolase family protein [Microbacteriaceae bacterium]
MIRNAFVDGQFVDIETRGGLITAIVPASGGTHGGDIDAGGLRVTAGLWDEHVHIRSWAQMLDRADLLPAEDSDAVVEILRNHPVRDGEPVIGHGLRCALWPESPKLADLDAVSRTVPVLAFSMDVHSVWINTAAAEKYGCLDVLDDTGILREHDCFRLLTMMSEIPEAEMDALIVAAAKDARAKGIVGITSFEMESLTDWDRRVANGFDIIKVNASLYPERIHEAYDRGLRTGDSIAGSVSMGFLKLITDGSINTKTAYMHEPFCGTDITGGLNTEIPELDRLVGVAKKHGVTPALHAIGDRANTVVIDAFEKAGVTGRIEHAQMVRPEDVARMGRLGLIASIQPTHAVDDRDVADVLWCGRTEYAYPMRSFLNAGVDVVFGSDAPVAKLDPWHTIRMATNRTKDARPAWHPEEALSFEEALRCSQRSTVDLGQPADLITLTADGELAAVLT